MSISEEAIRLRRELVELNGEVYLASTWAVYGVDGNGDGTRNVYDPADAIFAAARYLKANGAPQDLYRALWRYNHADWCVRRVMRYARGYAAAAGGMGEEFCPPPVAAPDTVAKRVLDYARMQLSKPYRWGAAGPDAFDCSGLAMRAYQYAGIAIPRVTYQQWRHGIRIPPGQERPGDLVFMRVEPVGPGHVGIVTTPGRMIHAPRTGDVIRRASYTARSDLVGSCVRHPWGPKMRPLTLTDLHKLPASIDILTAARALGLGRTKAYELAKKGQFPFRVIRIGSAYVVPAAELLKLLGVDLPERP